jgi:hypothetical protein
LSNGIFIGFHESIHDCIHEQYSRSLPQKDDDVLTIDAEETPVLEHEQEQQISGKAYKALTGPVQTEFEYKKNIPEKKRGFGPFSLSGKKPKPVNSKLRDEYRLKFMDRMVREGTIPAQYTNQLTAFMDKCTTRAEFEQRAGVALGNKNKDLLAVAIRYFEDYDKNRP